MKNKFHSPGTLRWHPLYCNKSYYSMTNTRFATAIHILTLLQRHEGELLSSEYLAGSVNLHPAVIRKEIITLKEHGLIDSKEGKGGGVFLAKPASKIKMTEVYNAITPSHALGKSNDPNPACPVGKHINKHLASLYSDAENAMFRKLSTVTLANFSKQFKS